MSSHKLPLGLVLEKATIVLLLLVNRLLLLRYVLVICHRAQDHRYSVESLRGN